MSHAEPAAGIPLSPAEPAYRHVLRARLALNLLPLVIGAMAADFMLLGDNAVHGIPAGLALLAALLLVALVPQRTHRRLHHRLTDRMLQSIHGWMFHVDTVVPLVRVQHLDVVRGPLDKLFGTATLVVHTAGTHNNVVTVDGLAPARAAEMRDAIRAQLRSDLE